MKVFLFPNIRCFQALYNILTIKILQNYSQIMKQNHAEKPCNLHWITPQLASDDHAFWLKQPCNLRQITPLHKWNCIRKTLKLKNNVRFLAFLFLFGDAPCMKTPQKDFSYLFCDFLLARCSRYFAFWRALPEPCAPVTYFFFLALVFTLSSVFLGPEEPLKLIPFSNILWKSSVILMLWILKFED